MGRQNASVVDRLAIADQGLARRRESGELRRLWHIRGSPPYLVPSKEAIDAQSVQFVCPLSG
jgi:hypothetical protein